MIDQRTRRRLSQDSGDSADRERESHALLVPLIAGEVNGEEWSNSRLYVGEKEIQPVQTTQASGGRRFGFANFRYTRMTGPALGRDRPCNGLFVLITQPHNAIANNGCYYSGVSGYVDPQVISFTAFRRPVRQMSCLTVLVHRLSVIARPAPVLIMGGTVPAHSDQQLS